MPKSEVNAPVTSAPTDRLALTESPGRGAEMSGLSRPACEPCLTFCFADDE